MTVNVDIRKEIFDTVSKIKPYDDLEKAHIEDVCQWIASGEQIFRIAKPDVPPKHLVSYFVLYDRQKEKILLVHHRKANLWLPAGGHVELQEHPQETVMREIQEELSIEAEFLFPDPVFVTVTETVGSTAGHTDVSLWYLLAGNADLDIYFDQEEFYTVKWFSLDEIPFDKADQHLGRFIDKICPIMMSSS